MGHRKLLIAGTGTANLKIIRERISLHYDSYKIHFSRSGRECIKKAMRRRYDLIMIDYQLGERNGIAVVESLRAKGVSTPIVLLIDEGEKARGPQAIRRGATDYLVKDINYFKRLPVILEELLGGKKSVSSIIAASEIDEEKGRYETTDTTENLPHEIAQSESVITGVDQLHMFNEIAQSILSCQDDRLETLLERIAEVGCQIFRFNKSTVALLDERENAFRKRIAIGYKGPSSTETRAGRISPKIIDQVFSNQFRVKMVYRDQSYQNVADLLGARTSERRTQKRRSPDQWKDGDLVLVSLLNEKGRISGYISFDDPEDGKKLSRDMFHNLEIYGKAASFAIENHHRYAMLVKRSRRLKKLLVTSNIFKLNLNLDELFNEIVWAIKFSSDFNLVALGVISKRSGNLEMKAVACDDKIVQHQLLELSFPLRQIIRIFRDEYRRGKTYFVKREESAFRTFKQVYYGSRLTESSVNEGWPKWGMLLVPIRSKESKTIGILMADDPEDSRMPSHEDIHILEILTNQFSIAIDNRNLYLQAKRKAQMHDQLVQEEEPAFHENPTLVIKRMAERIFKKN